MDWSSNLRNLIARSSVPDPYLHFLYNSSYGQIQGMEFPASYESREERKKKMSGEQVNALEKSFQEEIKLDPDRKMKLSRELGLQPRQIAVWFQNRRARWKGKQLERLYDALKMELEAVTREKHKLQEEVIKLRAMLREEGCKRPVSAAYTDASYDETVESASVVLGSAGKGKGNYEYNVTPSDYWPLPLLPPYQS